MAEEEPISKLDVARLSLTGIAMGLLTALVGLPPAIEPWLWLVIYVAWIALVVRYRVARPFWTIVLGSVATGVLASVIQVALFWQYRANNPWIADELKGTGRTGYLASFLWQGILAGAVFGIVAGALAARLRAILDARRR